MSDTTFTNGVTASDGEGWAQDINNYVYRSAPKWCGTAGGTANALTLAPIATNLAIAAYLAGQTFVFKSGASANTAAITVNVNGVGAIAGQVNGAACVGGEIQPNKFYRIMLDTTSTAQIEALANVGTLGTMQASTSGTSIDFTGIPPWATQIVITLKGVSTNGTDNYLIQIGDSGGIEASGYLGAGSDTFSASQANSTTGFIILTGSAAAVVHGALTLTLIDAATFLWAASGVFGRSDQTSNQVIAGSKATSAQTDRIRLTTTAGANTFDAGSVNIRYA